MDNDSYLGTSGEKIKICYLNLFDFNVLRFVILDYAHLQGSL